MGTGEAWARPNRARGYAGAVLGLAVLMWPAPAFPQSPPRSERITAAAIEALVDPVIREQLERRRIAGAVVVVVNDGSVALSRGYGQSDIATGRAMTTGTLVRIGSISKMLTPAAMWYACRLWAHQTGARWFRGREYLFVSAHVLLVMLSLQWRIAGTTLAL